jgi:hypothetical protein
MSRFLSVKPAQNPLRAGLQIESSSGDAKLAVKTVVGQRLAPAFARLGASISRPGLALRTEFTSRMVLWLRTMLIWSAQRYNFADSPQSPWHSRSWRKGGSVARTLAGFDAN